MYEKGVSVTTKTDDIRFTVPLYSVTEAAGILGVPPSTFSSWVGRGKQFRSNSGVTAPSAVVTSLETRGRQPTIPFVGLAEGLVLAAVNAFVLLSLHSLKIWVLNMRWLPSVFSQMVPNCCLTTPSQKTPMLGESYANSLSSEAVRGSSPKLSSNI